MIAWTFGTLYRIREDDVVYNTLPQYHTSGGVIASGQMLILGCTMVLRSKFSASNFWTDCIKHKCTVSIALHSQPCSMESTRKRLGGVGGLGPRLQHLLLLFCVI